MGAMKAHFQGEADECNGIARTIPGYGDMLNAPASAIPSSHEAKIGVIDLEKSPLLPA